jgi:hypothetical protein
LFIASMSGHCDVIKCLQWRLSIFIT